MKIYFIVPVRNATTEALQEAERCVAALEAEGHEVHFPPRDVDQSDPTGFEICRQHLAAMKLCEKVCVYWHKESTGSHFDLGMAFALGKPVEIVQLCTPDGPGKSYIKVMRQMNGGDYAPAPESIAFCRRDGNISRSTSLSEQKPA